MSEDLKELYKWDERIVELANNFGLNCYPQEFEVCDHNDMLGYMAYSGMPSRYPHWSFGKSFEKTKMLYNYGMSGLPYEMVINSNPCLAYLMRDNTLLLQILTIAHVYGHNDFFANNFTFTSATEAHLTLERFKIHRNRIESYCEDPSIGIDEVEKVIDDAHALCFQCRRNLAIKNLSEKEQLQRAIEKTTIKREQHWAIHPKKEYEQPDFNRLPLEPVEDLLLFIAKYNKYMPEWKRDILTIVDYETKYFIPQIETKIMNEGWASYWHFKILNHLKMESGLHLEFLVRHNQVLRPTPGGLNPYHLGFILWHDIEKRWNRGETGREWSKDEPIVDIETVEKGDYNESDFKLTTGRKKIFQIRECDRDASFLRQFLTPEIMRELQLFQHEKRGKERIVTKVSDDENWQDIKQNLIKNVGMGSFPVIKVVDADFSGNRTLYLKHEHEGRDLQLEYAEKTLRHINNLWEKDVILETELNGKKSLLKLFSGSLKIDRG